MTRKIEAAAFSALFILALAIPALNTNLKFNQRSEIDNRMLNELPGFGGAMASHFNEAATAPSLEDTLKAFAADVEKALQDRVGFRTEMLTSYLELNEALFGIMTYPLYMDGKDGHLYYNAQAYINGYSNIYDKERIEQAAHYLARIDEYLEERNVDFFFFLPPDKKTIYPEYFPDCFHKTDNPPIIEALLSRLDALNVDYVSPLDTFLALKNEVKLYNVLYDVAHWNQDGAAIGISLFLDKIREGHPEVLPLDRSNYERSITKVDRLLQSEYKIDEDVPLYTLKDDHATANNELAQEASLGRIGTICTVYDNVSLEDGLTALIFCDSYLGNYSGSQYHIFLKESFSRTVFVHSRNFYMLAWYLNVFSPDIAILETVERAIDVDGGAFNKTSMANTFFPHASSSELALNSSVNVSLEELDIARRSHLATISGKLTATGGAVTSVYVRIGDREYPAQADAAGRFSVVLATPELEGAPDIVLTPANEEEGVRYREVSF